MWARRLAAGGRGLVRMTQRVGSVVLAGAGLVSSAGRALGSGSRGQGCTMTQVGLRILVVVEASSG